MKTKLALLAILAWSSLLLAWCTSKRDSSLSNKKTAFMNQQQSNIIKTGSKVSFDYVGSFPSGEVFDTSLADVAKQNWIYLTGREYKPLEVVVGEHQIIPGLEEALIGHKEWDQFKVEIPPQKAYWDYNPEAKALLPISQFGTGNLPKVGDVIVVTNAQGQPFQVKVLEVNDQGVVIDLNHPMAGKTLVFEIYVRKVE